MGQVPVNDQTENKPSDAVLNNNPVNIDAPSGNYFKNKGQASSKPPATEPFSQGYDIYNILVNNSNASSPAITTIHRDSALLEFTEQNSDNRFFSGANFHAAGMVFNPGDRMLEISQENLPTLQYGNSYNFDSVTFPYWYNRPVDSIMKTDTFTSDSTAVEFLVDGDYQDSFKVSFDTTYRYTNTDTNVLLNQVSFFSDANNPFTVTKDTSFFPAFNIYDTSSNSNQVDTQMLMADRTLRNSQQQRSVIDKIEKTKEEVVDTLVIQYQIVEDNYISWIPAESGPFEGDTIRAATVPSNNAQAEMNEFDGEARIPLRTEDEFNFNNNNDVLDEATVEADIEVPAASKDLGEPFSIAASASFKPGYEIDGNDTLRVLDEEGNSVYTNNHIATVQNIFSGLLTNESWTNALTILSSMRYGSSNLADLFTSNFYMFNAPPEENPQNNPEASTARYFSFTFYISADESDNLDSNFQTSTREVVQEDNKRLNTKIYPNPASADDEVRVELSSNAKVNAEVTLYNTIGKQVKNLGTHNIQNKGTNTLRMNTQDLEPGVYFLNVRTSQGQTTRKISIVR